MTSIGENFVGASAVDRSKFLVQFLFELTLGYRDLYSGEDLDIRRKLYGINQANHYVLSFLFDKKSETNTNYTEEVLIRYIEDIGETYDINHQIETAWSRAMMMSENKR